MAGQDIIVVGASAGGVEALSRLVGDLPDDLPAAVFIVLHMAAHTGSPAGRSSPSAIPATASRSNPPGSTSPSPTGI